MDLKNLETASKIKSPLALAALVIIAVLLLGLALLEMDIFPELDKVATQEIVLFFVKGILAILFAGLLGALLLAAFKKEKEVKAPTSKPSPQKINIKKIVLRTVLWTTAFLSILILMGIYFYSNHVNKTGNYLLFEEFDQPDPDEWDLRNTNRVKIQEGRGTLKYYTDRNAYFTRAKTVPEFSDHSPNFELTATVKCLNCKENSFYGLDFGIGRENGITNKFFFYLNKKKQVAIGIANGDTDKTYFLDWENNFNVEDQGFNKLQVKNHDQLSEFFINGILIGSIHQINLFGDEIGFSFQNCGIEIDLVKIKI